MTAIIEIEKLTKTYGSHRGIIDGEGRSSQVAVENVVGHA